MNEEQQFGYTITGEFKEKPLGQKGNPTFTTLTGAVTLNAQFEGMSWYSRAHAQRRYSAVALSHPCAADIGRVAMLFGHEQTCSENMLLDFESVVPGARMGHFNLRGTAYLLTDIGATQIDFTTPESALRSLDELRQAKPDFAVAHSPVSAVLYRHKRS